VCWSSASTFTVVAGPLGAGIQMQTQHIKTTTTDFKILKQHRSVYIYRAASGHQYGLIQFIYLIFTA
jgi:uncharacterized membrane protein YsdA (DUF1294 family)